MYSSLALGCVGQSTLALGPSLPSPCLHTLPSSQAASQRLLLLLLLRLMMMMMMMKEPLS